MEPRTRRPGTSALQAERTVGLSLDREILDRVMSRRGAMRLVGSGGAVAFSSCVASPPAQEQATRVPAVPTPTLPPTAVPTSMPTLQPTLAPTAVPTQAPTVAPTLVPTLA